MDFLANYYGLYYGCFFGLLWNFYGFIGLLWTFKRILENFIYRQTTIAKKSKKQGRNKVHPKRSPPHRLGRYFPPKPATRICRNMSEYLIGKKKSAKSD